jgi:hypothetical protein
MHGQADDHHLDLCINNEGFCHELVRARDALLNAGRVVTGSSLGPSGDFGKANPTSGAGQRLDNTERRQLAAGWKLVRETVYSIEESRGFIHGTNRGKIPKPRMRLFGLPRKQARNTIRISQPPALGRDLFHSVTAWTCLLL